MYENCRNCGYTEGLHHFETMQCPKGGEAAPGRKQEWLNTVFVPDNDTEIEALESRILKLEKRIAALEKNLNE